MYSSIYMLCAVLSCFSRVQVLVTLWTVAHRALSMGFSRQEYWSDLPCPLPGDLPDPGIEAGSPALQADSLPLSYQGSPLYTYISICVYVYIYIWCFFRFFSIIGYYKILSVLYSRSLLSILYILVWSCQYQTPNYPLLSSRKKMKNLFPLSLSLFVLCIN